MTNIGTGTVGDLTGKKFDLGILGNTNAVERNYTGVQTQFQYRWNWLTVGGNWTWSHTLGSFDTENITSGPIQNTTEQYPEYKQMAWNAPYGGMASDQTHRIRILAAADLSFIPKSFGNFNVGLVQSYDTGAPYGAVGAVRSSLYVTNPGYQSRPTSVTYYYTARDAFRTDDIKRTDLALTYSYKIFDAVELFLQPQVLNVFNNQGVVAVDTTVRTAVSAGAGNTFQNFNPFTTTPVKRPTGRHDRHDGELGLRPELRQAAEQRRLPAAPHVPRDGGHPLLALPSFSSFGSRASARLLLLRRGWVTLRRCHPEGSPPPRALSCSSRPAAAAVRRVETFPGAPVILVSVDTLRSDHLPAYGYTGVETPALDALRKDSILFERAWSHVPLTLPSHASIFTGREPAAHGIHDNLGYRLKKDVPTLAELLKRGGYATGGAISCFVLKGAESGISRGFDFYDDAVEPAEGQQALGRVQRAGADTEARLETWLAAPAMTGRFFAFLHLYEPHTPYEPPEPFKTRYAAQPYDGEIAAADAIVGNFLAFLKARGLYDRALIVFLSDHGEGLGEHGESEHGMFLYRESLQVPLLVKLPGEKRAGETSSPNRRRSSTSSRRSPKARAPRASCRPEGTRSLLDPPPAPAARRILSETFFPRIHFGWSELSSLFDGRWHYIEAPKAEIYDVAADPGEIVEPARGEARRAARHARRGLESAARPTSPPATSTPRRARSSRRSAT